MFTWDISATIEILIRLAVASTLGALVGLERELHGRWAGLRTHMMVALGAAMFVSAIDVLGWNKTGDHGLTPDAVSRVIQGIAAGIGFLGAGTILKLTDRMEIRGLTTASSIWLAAAVGTASGLALYSLAVVGTVISLVVLAVLRPYEKRFKRKGNKEP